MRVVVDNTKGDEARFASHLEESLNAAGFEVDVREPSAHVMYDTAVHFVVEAVSVRVPEDIGRGELKVVAAAARDAGARRCSERHRVRAVPIYQGETAMIELTINGVSQSFPRVWTALHALARLGDDPRHFGLRHQDGTWVGSTGTLGELLSDGDELELAA